MPLRFFPHCRHITSGEAVLTFEAGTLTTTSTSVSQSANTPHAYLRACRLHSALYTQPPVYLTWDILTVHDKGQEHAQPTHTTASVSCPDVANVTTTTTCSNSMCGTAQVFAPYMHHAHTRHVIAAAATASQPVRIRQPSHTHTQKEEDEDDATKQGKARRQQLYDEAKTTIAQPHYQTHHAIPSCPSPALHSPRPVPHTECTTLAYILPFAQDKACATVYAAASSCDIEALLLFDADYTLLIRQEHHQNSEVQAVYSAREEEETDEVETKKDVRSAESTTANAKDYTLVPLRRRHTPPPAAAHSLREGILAEWADIQQRVVQLRTERHTTLQTRTEELRHACSELHTKRSICSSRTTRQASQPLCVTSYPSQTSFVVHDERTTALHALPGQDVSVSFDELRYFAHRAWRTWCGNTSSSEEKAKDEDKANFTVLTPPLCALENVHRLPRCIHRQAHSITCRNTSPTEKQGSHVAQDLLRQALQSSTWMQNTRPPVKKAPCPTPPPPALLPQPAHTPTATSPAPPMPACMAAQPPLLPFAYDDEADMQRRWWCCHTLAAAAADQQQQQHSNTCEMSMSEVMQYIQPHTSELLWCSDVMAHTQSRTARRALRNKSISYVARAQELLRTAMQQTPPLQTIYKSNVAHDGQESSNNEVSTGVVQLRNFAASAVVHAMRRHNAQGWRLWSSAMTTRKDSEADEAAVQGRLMRIRAERTHTKNEGEEKKAVCEQLMHDALSTLSNPCRTRAAAEAAIRRHAALLRSCEAAVAELHLSLRVVPNFNSTVWLDTLLSVCVRREHQLRMHSFYYDLLQALYGDGQQQQQEQQPSPQEYGSGRTEGMTSSTPAWLRPGTMAHAVAEPCEYVSMRDEAERWPGESGLLPWCDDADEEDEDDSYSGRSSCEAVQAAVVRSTRYMFANIISAAAAAETRNTCREHHSAATDAANATCACEADVYASLRRLAADVLQSSQQVLRRRRGGGQGMGGARRVQPVFSLEAQLETHVQHLRTSWAQTSHHNDTNNDDEERDGLVSAWMQGVEAIYCRTLGVRDVEGRQAMQMHFAYMHAMLRTQQQVLQAYYSSE